MSKTLFAYVFRDLLRIFFLTSGALAGIMSFGGLLRPLTEHGLDGSQVVQMLTYFMPAMTTYSLPIAALFATTMVYGRLSADNELTACRSAGISWLSIALPALVLGLIVAIVSLLFLCFIVPVFSLKVERVIYSNLAQLVADQIERTHQVRVKDKLIYAQEAYVPPADPSRPDEQIVTLIGPMFVHYQPTDKADPGLYVPDSFSLAQQADVIIRQNVDQDTITLEAILTGGVHFPRGTVGGLVGGIEQPRFGPTPFDSPIREETKFMDIARLQELDENPEQSRRVGGVLKELIRKEQQNDFLKMIRKDLLSPRQTFSIEDGQDTYTITQGGATVDVRRGEMALLARPNVGGRPIRFTHYRGNDVMLEVAAREVGVELWPDNEHDRLAVNFSFHEAMVRSGEENSPRNSFPRSINVPMPEKIRKLKDRSTKYYLTAGVLSADDHQKLARELMKLRNSIHSERHGRASFAVGCFILVVVGCALGMMFKSGNFLSAFAVSVIPALLSIALVVTGQQTCENISSTAAQIHDPLSLGLGLIWSGNVIVLIIAVVLMARLQKQ